MASLRVLIVLGIVVSVLAANLATVEGKEFKVGGSEGWHEPALNATSMYNDWAIKKRFRIGDLLVFEYRNDSVLVVDKFGYYHCNASDPVLALDNGNSTIVLDRSGPFYFISGDSVHCRNGQRLLVEVMAPHPVHHSPPSIANPPGSGFISPALSPLSSSGAFFTSAISMRLVMIAFTAALALVGSA